jgi:hypothetical protein
MTGLEKLGWLEDVERALVDGRSRPKQRDAVPHYMRCDHYRAAAEGAFHRCRLADGHQGGHEPSVDDAPKEAAK